MDIVNIVFENIVGFAFTMNRVNASYKINFCAIKLYLPFVNILYLVLQALEKCSFKKFSFNK